MPLRIFLILLFLCGDGLLTGVAISQQNDIPQSVVVRGLWRSGEMARYELEETTRIYNNGVLVEERELSTLVHIDVAARRAGDSYVLIWQILETNAPLFDDPELDNHMYGLLADGIVVHTDNFGGFDHASNIDDLYGHFVRAMEELDRQNYWNQRTEQRDQLNAYLNNKELFESLLLRDMKFMFGLHGVQVYTDDEYRYDTWQENPWGEPAVSKGRLFVEGYDENERLLHIRNIVEMAGDAADSGLNLEENQLYVINARHGWPHMVELNDKIVRDDFRRTRTLKIRKVPF